MGESAAKQRYIAILIINNVSILPFLSTTMFGLFTSLPEMRELTFTMLNHFSSEEVNPSVLFEWCRPFPFMSDSVLAVTISSLESPLWWAFYGFVIFEFLRHHKVKFLQDPLILLTLTFLARQIAFSALMEVSLGISIARRAIHVVP